MTDLTFAILKYGFLIGLWIFVWLAVRAINRDIESLAPHRSRRRGRNRDTQREAMVAVSSRTPVVVPTDNSLASQYAASSSSAPLTHSTNNYAPAVLTIIDGPLSGTTMPLSSEPITLGRAANNDVILDDEFVSSHHARVFHDAHTGQWAVEDLGSTNGTKVAGQPIHSVSLLSPGVPVRIGATTFELR
ncbi:FHA domain-containing protein [Alloscardovia theropitheci]|uniref:FHA domain-containing protein n=1 Tax=Alloscardovia theropitheci TaxID=2496842 RepID=A0A4R0QXK2_9BIFI|nr:FHA domain-containing protein [Alloscardovia theropitheci]TCD54350.1 FHA domain-containing protein [Alloscardovia theropitheci]